GEVQSRPSGLGGREIRLPAGPLSYVLLGVWDSPRYLDIDPYDCIQHTVWAQLVMWDPTGVNDLADAGLMLQCGADWYAEAANFTQYAPIPGLQVSRLKTITATPQRFSA